MKMMRPEYPNPQFERKNWTNLNGEWEFELDTGKSGEWRGLHKKAHLDGKINVPFCPESKLSGIGNTDFLECVWYRRDIEIPEEHKGKRVIVHFGAVDHISTVYVNGNKVGTHMGGFVGFEFDITDYLADGTNSLCLCALDETRDPLFGHGKQAIKYASSGCHYTRVTGIWQTVWLEYVPAVRIKNFRVYPNIENSTLGFTAETIGAATLKAIATYEGKVVGETEVKCLGGHTSGTIALSELHLWEVGKGRLYDLTLTYGEDEVKSYFGMRSLAFDGMKFLLNGKSVYQRLVLDQGFYPDGIYTASSEEALVNDIKISMAAGFNGARLHQKVFEPRFLYHADKMGYMVWGEYGNWGMDYSNIAVLPRMLEEWLEIVERDFNHPSIVGWCPLNETWNYEGRRQDNFVVSTIYKTTKAVDVTRPCIDTSGNFHVITDIYDIHDYSQDPEIFGELWKNEDLNEGIALLKKYHPEQTTHQGKYEGQPFFISEYGGIKWDVNSGLGNAWGYGNAPKTEEEFIARYRGLTDILLDNPKMFGFCYTQLYDVEQEVNGLYTYERQPKFDMDIFKKINERKAKIEE